MNLDQNWRRDVYIIGIISLVFAILLSILIGWAIITSGVRDMPILGVVVALGVLWVLGIGCLLKADTFGRTLAEWAEREAYGN